MHGASLLLAQPPAPTPAPARRADHPPLARAPRSAQFAWSLECALRGHLLMRLEHRAAAAGLAGVTPELQGMVQPLVECMQQDGGATHMLQLACAQVGAACLLRGMR